MMSQYSRRKLLFFEQNEIFLINKKNKYNSIGIFSEGIATCGSIIISFDNDKYLLFCHFDETFLLIDEIEAKIKELVGEKIKKINIFLSQGIGPIENKSLDYDKIIEKLRSLIQIYFVEKVDINIFHKKHNCPISCLKIVEDDQNNEDNLFNKIMVYALCGLKKSRKLKWENEMKDKAISIFERQRNEEHNKFNLSYYFTDLQIKNILTAFGIGKLFIKEINK